jgi:putative ABC transport system permease protein
MTSLHLILRELRHRKLNFALSIAAIAAASAALVSLVLVLDGFDLETARILAAHEAVAAERGKAMEDDVRKITLGLGFNILILPKDQQLGDIYAEGYAGKTMPEEYVGRLANGPIDSLEHLLPSLEQKIVWPERKRTVLLVGIRGEVAKGKGKVKKPLIEAVAPGQIVLGHEIHRELGLKSGDKLTLMGDEFTVGQCYPARGSKDDITVWIELATAQRLLAQQGRINGIWALECNCNTIDRLAEVRGQVAKILPDTQVIEVATQATARAEARKLATREATTALANAKSNRLELRGQLERLAAGVIPLGVAAAAIWVGLLSLANVRERRAEIGILRAIGVRSRQVLGIFLGKAALGGLLAALVGIPLGIALAGLWLGRAPAEESVSMAQVLSRSTVAALWGVFVGAPVVAILASWLPALSAAQQDPARVLCEE